MKSLIKRNVLKVGSKNGDRKIVSLFGLYQAERIEITTPKEKNEKGNK